MSVSMVSRSLFTSSGRVTFFAALASFHPSEVHHLDMVTRDTSTFSAISVCSIPERNSERASDFFFRFLPLSYYKDIGLNGRYWNDCTPARFVRKVVRLSVCRQNNVQRFHRSVQPLHTFLAALRVLRNIAGPTHKGVAWKN